MSTFTDWAKQIAQAAHSEPEAERPMTADDWAALSQAALHCAEIALPVSRDWVRISSSKVWEGLALKCALRAEAMRQGRVMP